jgi:hypothetical protein
MGGSHLPAEPTAQAVIGAVAVAILKLVNIIGLSHNRISFPLLYYYYITLLVFCQYLFQKIFNLSNAVLQNLQSQRRRPQGRRPQSVFP